MRNTDKQALAAMLGQIYETFGKELTEGAVRLWFAVLEPYELNDVQAALTAILRTSQFLPKPGDVVNLIDPPQWPTAPEAWANHPKDERDTGAVCDQTLAAWASAEGLWSAGDAIGAKRAFEGAYERHKQLALNLGKRRPLWRLSLGWGEQGRKLGADASVRSGLLTEQQVAGLLGYDEETTPYRQLTDSSRGERKDLRPLREYLGGADGSGAGRGVRVGTAGVEAGEKAERVDTEEGVADG